jgi:hypothetical protein
MQNIQEKILMEKFLKLNYPVRRLKHNKRFKRSILLDNRQLFLLSDKEMTKDLYFKLLDILKLIFRPDELTSRDVLKDFLHLKTQVLNNA